MMTIPAIYRKGGFEIDRHLDLAEGSSVSLRVSRTGTHNSEPVMEDLTISDPSDERPMTAEEIDQWRKSYDSVRELCLSDEEFAQSEADRLERKREQLALLPKWEMEMEELFR